VRVIPVLDLRAGRAVHARRGERDAYAPVSSCLTSAGASNRDGDPLAIARSYREVLGLSHVYVADLDAIRGDPPQHEMIRALAGKRRERENMELWVDGGVSSVDSARAVMESGAGRVIVGLETLPSWSVLRDTVQAHGAEHVAFSLDLRGGEPMTRGTDLIGRTPLALATRAADVGVEMLLVLDVARVGTGSGVDLALVQGIRRTLPELELIAGGGVGGWSDLERLAAAGAHGALVASALHDGRIGAREIQAIAQRA
jgi:phosphoribosylformimino-5-aminoimidazole carboxamide ribotide isomerase